MTTYTVYSPFSNTVLALDCYCYNRTYDPCQSSACPAWDDGTKPYCKDKTACLTCGGSCFCNYCCQHTIVGGSIGYCCPLDIKANVDQWIYAYLSSSIMSVKLVRMTGVCANYTGEINQGVYLEAYTGSNATGTKLGRLLYAHVKNQAADNSVWNRVCCQYPWVVTIGQVPAYPGIQSCYGGTHTHFSIRAEAGVTASRMSSYSCGQTAYAGSTPIYWWTR